MPHNQSKEALRPILLKIRRWAGVQPMNLHLLNVPISIRLCGLLLLCRVPAFLKLHRTDVAHQSSTLCSLILPFPGIESI